MNVTDVLLSPHAKLYRDTGNRKNTVVGQGAWAPDTECTQKSQQKSKRNTWHEQKRTAPKSATLVKMDVRPTRKETKSPRPFVDPYAKPAQGIDRAWTAKRSMTLERQKVDERREGDGKQ